MNRVLRGAAAIALAVPFTMSLGSAALAAPCVGQYCTQDDPRGQVHNDLTKYEKCCTTDAPGTNPQTVTVVLTDTITSAVGACPVGFVAPTSLPTVSLPAGVTATPFSATAPNTGFTFDNANAIAATIAFTCVFAG